MVSQNFKEKSLLIEEKAKEEVLAPGADLVGAVSIYDEQGLTFFHMDFK